MDSKEIEARAQKIVDLIGELHCDLVEDDQTAWLHDLPGLSVHVEPNRLEVTISIKIGKAEDY